MNDCKVTIQIVTWNSMKYLPECLNSIFAQTYRDFHILVIDNNSQDGTVQFLRTNYPDISLIQNNKNLGFSKGNNQGIRLINSPYVVLCNSDIILEPNWLELMVATAELPENLNYGSFGGKLLKLKVIGGDLNEVEKTEVIDSCGLKLLKSHLVVEIAAGEDVRAVLQKQEVFGHSGALVMYRMQALQDCIMRYVGAPDGECFDEDFFLYKEDVDLAWRLQLMGWKSLMDPSIIAYHVRSASGSENRSVKEILNNRKTKSKLANFYSYRNHFLMLIKNESASIFFKYFFYIFWYELKKFIYVLLFEAGSLKAFGQILSLWPRMKKKRKFLFAEAKVSPDYMKRWVS